MNVRRTLAVFVMVVGVGEVSVYGQPLSTFDGGSLEGWSVYSAISGDVGLLSTGGNPGGYMYTTDTQPGGPAVRVKGPASFSGDLSMYTGISWDGYVYDNGGNTTRSIKPCIFGSDGTIWTHGMPLDDIGSWYSAEVTFEESAWSGPLEGSMTFADVLSDGTIGFYTDTSDLAGGYKEAGLDNIALLPEPGTLLLLVVGGLGLRWRRFP